MARGVARGSVTASRQGGNGRWPVRLRRGSAQPDPAADGAVHSETRGGFTLEVELVHGRFRPLFVRNEHEGAAVYVIHAEARAGRSNSPYGLRGLLLEIEKPQTPVRLQRIFEVRVVPGGEVALDLIDVQHGGQGFPIPQVAEDLHRASTSPGPQVRCPGLVQAAFAVQASDAGL